MIRQPNLFQASVVLAFILLGGAVGANSRVDIGHATWIGPLLGAIAGALLGLFVSGLTLMVTNYWRNRGRDE